MRRALHGSGLNGPRRPWEMPSKHPRPIDHKPNGCGRDRCRAITRIWRFGAVDGRGHRACCCLQGRTEIEAPGTPGRNGCDLGGEHSWFPTLAVSRPCFGWRHPAQRLLWRCRSVCHDAWRERIEVRVRPCRALVSNVMFRSDVCIDAGVRHRAATASTRRSGC